jgi:hypothetical protein
MRERREERCIELGLIRILEDEVESGARRVSKHF